MDWRDLLSDTVRAIEEETAGWQDDYELRQRRAPQVWAMATVLDIYAQRLRKAVLAQTFKPPV